VVDRGGPTRLDRRAATGAVREAVGPFEDVAESRTDPCVG